jgi:hypothetical protein
VDRYGYYFLFLMNLPAYAEKIWVLENANYMHLMPIKEKRKNERELAAEAEEEGDDEENSPDTGGTAGDEHIEDQWKDVKKYSFYMRDLGQLMRINIKLSVKHVFKKGPKPNKYDPALWDALPWEGQEKHLHDLPIQPCVSRMWKALFPWENKTPLQKLMVAVNRGSSTDSMSETLTKKELVESLDYDILQTENQRALIERLEEACKDIVDDVRHSNHARKTNIPETFIARLDQIEK